MDRRIGMAIWVGLVALSGCSSTNNPFGREKLATMPVGPSYVGGRGYESFPTAVNLTENVRDAMAQVGMTGVRQVPEANGATAFEGETADRRSARVTIQTTGVRSLVSMKVGWKGDEPLTRAFLEQVGQRQGTLSPSAEPAEGSDPTLGSPTATPPMPAGEPAPSRFSRSAVPDSIMLRNQLDPSIAP